MDTLAFTTTDLNIVFGLKASRGKTSEFGTRLREHRDDRLMTAVLMETLRGSTIENACSTVAHRLADYKCTHSGSPVKVLSQLGHKDPQAAADTIRKRFYRWKRKYVGPLIACHQQPFLALKKYATESRSVFAKNFYGAWTPFLGTNQASLLFPSISRIFEIIDNEHDSSHRVS